MAHNSKGKFKKLDNFFKGHKKNKNNSILLPISEIENIIGKTLPTASKSKSSNETLWNNFSEPSVFWKKHNYELIKFDFESQEILFRIDSILSFNAQRELDKEEAAFKRIHVIEMKEAIKQYMASDSTSEDYWSTDLYLNDSWVDTKRVALGGIEEAKRTLELSEDLGCYKEYNDILFECLTNFSTQKLRKESFFKNIKEAFPNANITQDIFIDIERFYRTKILPSSSLDKHVVLNEIYNYKVENHFKFNLSIYNDKVNDNKNEIEFNEKLKIEKRNLKQKEYIKVFIVIILIISGIYLIGQFNEALKPSLKDNSVCEKLGLRSNWNDTKCY